MPEVVVYLLEGRSLEQKRGLVKDITQAPIKSRCHSLKLREPPKPKVVFSSAKWPGGS